MSHRKKDTNNTKKNDDKRTEERWINPADLNGSVVSNYENMATQTVRNQNSTGQITNNYDNNQDNDDHTHHKRWINPTDIDGSVISDYEHLGTPTLREQGKTDKKKPKK